jgi:DNA helicase-2/ATP-dependent DNA helicase PcrA
MWQNDKSPQAHSRLENLKELIRHMQVYDSLAGFLEHISLVMDTDTEEAEDKVSLMTLHSAKGLEFSTVFLAGWEEGLFPHQRALDESGEAGLEEERRLAYVGLTRAKERAKITFAQSRMTHGLWQPATRSRFIDELPPAHVDELEFSSFGGYGMSRFDEPSAVFAADYATPGWQRAQRNARQGTPASRRGPITIDGELVAASSAPGAGFSTGERVFHQKFGYGHIAAIDGNKITVDFDKAGRKKVVDSFVKRV